MARSPGMNNSSLGFSGDKTVTPQENIYELASSILGIPEAELSPDVLFSEYFADSLDLVEFVFAVQEGLHVSFETPESNGLKTPGDLVRAVNEKTRSNDADRPSV
jgi:acyl carrier protein